MKKTTDIIFPVLILIALLLPALYFVGVKEQFVSLNGVERIPEPAPLTVKNYGNSSFQKKFDEIFAKKFFLRKCFSYCKNQLYAWCNFGFFYSQTVSGGKDRRKWLVETGYLTSYFSNEKLNADKNKNSFVLLGKLAAEFKKRGIDFIFILAPDKVSMYPERLPGFYSLYLKRTAGPPLHASFGKILEKYQVPYFDAHSFLEKSKNQVELFPRTGIHWSAQAVCMALAEMLQKLNERKSSFPQYVVPVPAAFKKDGNPKYGENDLGRLANLIFSPPEVGFHPVFPPAQGKNAFDVFVLGDSFSGQIFRALTDSRSFNRVFIYSNATPSAPVFYRQLNRTKLFILVYTTPKLVNGLKTRHGDLQKIYDMLRRYHAPGQLPFGMNLPFTDLDNNMMSGFFGRERKGRWTGRECTLRLPVPASVKQPLQMTFTGWPLTNDQVVTIKNSRNKVLGTLSLPRHGNYQVAISPEDISNDNRIVLKLEFPHARRSAKYPSDPRILSFFFTDIKLDLLPGKSTGNLQKKDNPKTVTANRR